MSTSTALATDVSRPLLHKLPTNQFTPAPSLSLVHGQHAAPSEDTGPASTRRRVPTQTVTLVEFSCQVMVTDSRAFRFRWTLIHAKRTIRGLWTDGEVEEGIVRVTERWQLLFPDAASACLEVEGGTAGPVRATRVSSRQEPEGKTFAIDAV